MKDLLRKEDHKQRSEGQYTSVLESDREDRNGLGWNWSRSFAARWVTECVNEQNAKETVFNQTFKFACGLSKYFIPSLTSPLE